MIEYCMPCLFCRKEVTSIDNQLYSFKRYKVVCCVCNATGPSAHTSEEAVMLWNGPIRNPVVTLTPGVGYK